jgi:2-polyprenyl-6-methoxyphenol hydroxylase-like FAD-dependent oxidoreductase
MDTDVVIAGGGIAGSALAATLAGEGLDVLVLERQESYVDQVRGEGLWPWGVAEAERLGVHDALLQAAGGCHVGWLVDYRDGSDPGCAESEPVPLSQMVEGVPGSLNVGHPMACRTLMALARDRGAEVATGVDQVEIDQGELPAVRFAVNGDVRQVRCRLVVGADGRNSTVRRQLGIALERAPASHLVSGLLVEGLDMEPGKDFAGIGNDVFVVAFPQAGGKARLYLFHRAERPAFNGPDGARNFIEASALDYLPNRERWFQAVPAGPCRSFRCDDTWTERPYGQGVVLIGDAAGYNDPLIGQGLALALRDARALCEALLNGSSWNVSALDTYGTERAERLRRMRSVARLYAIETVAFGQPARAVREGIQKRIQDDPTLLDGPLAMFLGPDLMNPEVATDEFHRRYFAMQ